MDRVLRASMMLMTWPAPTTSNAKVSAAVAPSVASPAPHTSRRSETTDRGREDANDHHQVGRSISARRNRDLRRNDRTRSSQPTAGLERVAQHGCRDRGPRGRVLRTARGFHAYESPVQMSDADTAQADASYDHLLAF